MAEPNVIDETQNMSGLSLPSGFTPMESQPTPDFAVNPPAQVSQQKFEDWKEPDPMADMSPTKKAMFILAQGAMAFGEGITGKPFFSNFQEMQSKKAQRNFEVWKQNRESNKTKPVIGFDPSGKQVNLGEVDANAVVKSIGGSSDLSTLDPEYQITAYSLARKVGGVRGAEKVLPAVIANLKSGTPIDQIEDKIRFSTQSNEFNQYRDAAQSMSIGKSETIRNADYDALDDYAQKGNIEGAKSYLKKMAISDSTADQQKTVMGKERTVEFLGEIKDDLKTLEKAGYPTGFWSGNYENVLAKVGQVKNPEMRKIATKIATAMMTYRRDMTGVQFTEKEAKEYARIFPSIDKVGRFNSASIDGLRETFNGDLKMFYKQKMGKDNYSKIFSEETQKSSNSFNEDDIAHTLKMHPEYTRESLLKKLGR